MNDSCKGPDKNLNKFSLPPILDDNQVATIFCPPVFYICIVLKTNLWIVILSDPSLWTKKAISDNIGFHLLGHIFQLAISGPYAVISGVDEKTRSEDSILPFVIVDLQIGLCFQPELYTTEVDLESFKILLDPNTDPVWPISSMTVPIKEKSTQVHWQCWDSKDAIGPSDNHLQHL